MICIKCKKEISDESQYCNYCGTSQQDTTINLQIFDTHRTKLFDIRISTDKSELDLYQIVSNNLRSRNIDYIELYTPSQVVLGRQCRNLTELNLKDNDILYLKIFYLESPTSWGDMRCLYGCPMSKRALTEAENYTDEDSNINIK